MAAPHLTAARLRELLDYCPATGLFSWKVKVGPNVTVGKVAGMTQNDGYRQIGIDGSKVPAHRVAWVFLHGRWPTGQIDHINGVRSDNSAENLREVTHSGNCQNVRKARRDSVSGVQGVRAVGNRFEARLRIDGRGTCLGFFSSEAEAYAAYVSAKRRHHPGFAG